MTKLLVRIIFTFLFCTVLSAQPLTYSPQIQSLCDKVDQTKIQNHISNLCWADGHQSRITFTPGNYAAAEYIAQYFESLPGITTVVRDTFFISSATNPYNTYPVVNVSAILQGSDPDSGYIILGAHYDASGSHEGNWNSSWQTIKAQGADDNATGIVGLLEAARILSDPVNGLNNVRTIEFIAFGAEEYHPMHPDNHHMGSLHDAISANNSNENLQLAIILDMFGYNPLKDYVEVISNASSLWLADRVYEAVSLYTPSLQTNTTPANVPYSDHDSYQLYGYPSILLMENDRPWNSQLPHYQANPYYHSVGDTISTLNFSLVTKVVKSALAAIAHLSAPEITSIATSRKVDEREEMKVSIFPNPSNSQTTFKLSLTSNQFITIEVYSSLGKKITTLADNVFWQKGDHRLRWNTNHLASGIYFVKLQDEHQVSTSKLIVIK